MSVVVSITKSNLHISKRRLPQLLVALKAAATSPFFEFATHGAVTKADTLEKLLGLTSLRPQMNRDGDVTGFDYVSDQLPKDCGPSELHSFLAHVAPYVRKGGLLELASEGTTYVFGFDGDSCTLTAGRRAQAVIPPKAKKPKITSSFEDDAEKLVELLASDRVAETAELGLELFERGSPAQKRSVLLECLQALERAGQADRAERLLRENLTIALKAKDVELVGGWGDLFRFLLRHARWDEAADLFETHLRDFASSHSVGRTRSRWQRAFVLLTVARYDALADAIPWCCGKYGKDLGNRLLAMHYRAARLIELARLDDATSELAGLDALAAEAAKKPSAMLRLAVVRCRMDQAQLLAWQGKSDASRAVCEPLSRDPRSDWTGAVLLGAGRPAEALERAQSFEEDEPLASRDVASIYWPYEALVVCGRSLIELERPEDAIRALTEATSKIPAAPLAWYHLARAHALAGTDGAETTKLLVRATERSPGFAWLAANDPRLTTK